MSKKSRIFLGLACVAFIVALVSRLAFSANDVSDFATGLAVALMVGVLVTWKGRRTPQS